MFRSLSHSYPALRRCEELAGLTRGVRRTFRRVRDRAGRVSRAASLSGGRPRTGRVSRTLCVLTGRPRLAACLLLSLLSSFAFDPIPAVAQSDGVELAGHFQLSPELGVAYNDIWGYSAPDGTELAILGSTRGTHFIDVTDPSRPSEVRFIEGSPSIWRDMKTYRHYAYSVNEGGGGLQVIDLADPLDPTLVNIRQDHFTTAHNIFVDEGAGTLWVVGARRAAPDNVFIYSLEPDPASPRLITDWDGAYLHDVYVRDGLAYGAALYEGELWVLDVSNLPVIEVLGTVETPGTFTHNTWLTEDGRYCLTTDENPGGHVGIVDVQDPTNPTLVAEWSNPEGPRTIVHNALVAGDFAYVSWYTTGLQILDLRDPLSPVRAGWYDTFPGTSSNFDGAWGVYPFARHGYIYVSDIATGLYVLRFDAARAKVEGVVRDSGTGSPLPGVRVSVTGSPERATTDIDGVYSLRLLPGSYVLDYSLFGYLRESRSAVIEGGTVDPLDVELAMAPVGTVEGVVVSVDGTPVAGVHVRILEGTEDRQPELAGGPEERGLPSPFPGTVNSAPAARAPAAWAPVATAAVADGFPARARDGSPTWFVRGRQRGARPSLPTALEAETDENGRFSFGAVPSGEQTVALAAFGVPEEEWAVEIRTGTNELRLVVFAARHREDFEGATTSWTVGGPEDTAVSGIWERGEPVALEGNNAQPSEDHSPHGTHAFLTGLGEPGQSESDHDVDGGGTTLTSPVYDLSGLLRPAVSFSYWYENSNDFAVPDDEFVVEASADGGQTWSRVFATAEAGRTWRFQEVLLGSEFASTPTFQIRFIASDLGAPSLVEAALDDVEIFEAKGRVVGSVVTEPGGAVIGQVTDLGSGTSVDIGADGAFELLAVPGELQLAVQAFGLVERTASVVIPSRQTVNMRIEMVRTPTQTVTGTVRAGAGGTPLAGVLVECVDTPLTTSTDERGRWQLQVPAGNYVVRFVTDDFAVAEREISISEPGGPVTLEVGLDPTFATSVQQVFPNPAALDSVLRFRLARAAGVRVEVFDPSGRRVRTVWEGELGVGEHEVRWDGRTDDGRTVAAGLYFQRFRGDGLDEVRRVVRIR